MAVIIVGPGTGGGGGGDIDWEDMPTNIVGITNLDSTITTAAKSLLDDADYATMRATLELDGTIDGINEGDRFVWDGVDSWDVEQPKGAISIGQTPVVGTKVISDYPNFRGVITGVYTKLGAGTLTLSVSVDGVAVPGLSSVSVTTARAGVAATGSGVTFNASSVITYTIASPTAATDFTASVLVTRIRNT
jgi:hypothetical protein